MNLTAPTDNLQHFAGQMLQDVGVEIVTGAALCAGQQHGADCWSTTRPDKTLPNAHLFLEFIDISGTVVSEVPTQVTLPPGPTYTPVTFASTGFSPPSTPARTTSSWPS